MFQGIVRSNRFWAATAPAFAGWVYVSLVFSAGLAISIPIAALVFASFWLVHPFAQERAVRAYKVPVRVNKGKDTGRR